MVKSDIKMVKIKYSKTKRSNGLIRLEAVKTRIKETQLKGG